MSLLLDHLFTSVALSHFVVDVLNGQVAVLLAYLSGPLGLTNASIGLVTTVYTVAGSLIQPLFGVLSDRLGPRWVVSLGVLWMAIFFSLAMIIPGRAALTLLVLAAIGSGAFHPAGTMQATIRGRNAFADRETTATSFFFLFGQAGLFLGPFLAGFLLDASGKRGLLMTSVLAVPVGLNAAYRLRSGSITHKPKPQTQDPSDQTYAFGLVALLTFALLTALRAWVQQSMIVFVPKYLSDLGVAASIYGSLAALFMGGSAVGNVVGGNLADRHGKRRVTTITLALASVPIFLLVPAGWSPWLYLLIPLAGALSGASHSIVVVLAQRLIPGGMGLASGLILGFMFSSGALGALLSGYFADLWGIAAVFTLSGGLALLAAAFANFLPKT